MQINIQLIQIVKHPNNKNCWLAVDNYPQLVSQYSSLIQDYDFIDFEGEVFYYNVLSKYDLEVNKAFYKRNKPSEKLVNKEDLVELLNFVVSGNKQEILASFIENETVVLLNY